MKYLYKFINNKLFINLAVKNDTRLRRKNRPKWMKDSNDVFILMHSEEYMETIPHKFADKIYCKKLAQKIGCLAPKTLFSFGKNGNIESGKIPSEGKVVLKSNNGSGFVKIVDVSTINSKFLKKIYKKWFNKSTYFGQLKGESQYMKNNTILYGEEFISDNIEDYRVHQSNEGVVYDFCSDRWKNNEKSGEINHFEYTSEFQPLYSYYSSNKSPEISKTVCLNLKKIKYFADKAFKIVGRYARFDFYVVNGDVYMGEVTFTSANGRFYNNASIEAYESNQILYDVIKGNK